MGTATNLALLPGLGCDAAVWTRQVAGLGELVVPHVPDLAGGDDIASLARSTLAVLPDRFALVGHSMGGYVALEIMRRAPERVTRLALINTQPQRDTPEQADRRRRLVAQAERGEFDAVLDELLPLQFHPALGPDDAVVDAARQMAERVGQVAFLRQQRAIVSRVDSTPTLSTITCPTLVIGSDHDVIAPVERSRQMADRIAGATLVVLESCGHMGPMERPDEVTAHLRDWLTA